MAFTAGFSVNVGDPTKASDVDVLAANDDYLKNAIDTFIANDANNRVLTATGSGTANAESNLTFDGSTLTVTGTVTATTFNGNVTGNLSGNVTGGTISGTTGTFTGALSAQTLTANNGALYLDDNGTHNGLINVPASLFLNIDSDNGATNEKFQIAKDRTGSSGGTVLFELGEDGDLDVTGGISGTTGAFTSTISTSGGYVTVAGNPSAGTISSNGNGQIGGLTGNGLFMYGKGSTYDLALANATTNLALAIPTGGGTTPDVYIPNALGIGTSSAGAALDVAHSGASAAFRVYNSQATNPYGILIDNTAANLSDANYVADFRVGGYSILRLNNSGQMTFAPNSYGGVSAGTLTVKTGSINSDSIRLEAGGTTSSWLESRGYLGHSWYVDSTRSMTLDSTGLGIGTSSPTKALSVVGDAVFDGPTQSSISSGASRPGAVLNLDGNYDWSAGYTGGDYNGQILFNTSDASGHGAGVGAAIRSMAVDPYGRYSLDFHTTGNDATEGNDALRMRITATGNVGIGTASAGEKLTVIGGGSTSSTANFTGGAAANDNATLASDYSMYYQIDANNTVGGRIYNWRVGGKGYSDGTSLLTLNASGNMGLGDTPNAYNSAHRALQLGSRGANIAGRTDGDTIYVNANAYQHTDGNWKYDSTDEASQYYQTGGTHNWRRAASGTAGTNITWTTQAALDSTGLGVGTSSPAATLHLQHPAQTSGYWEDKGLLIHEDATADRGIALYSRGGSEHYIASLIDDANSYLVIGARKSSATNGVDAITVRGSGNVGIGTTSPRYNLAVKGNNSTAVGIAVDNDSGSSTADISALGASYNAHGAAAGEIWFYSPDNINIGGATGNTNDIKFLGNGSERARLTSAGNFGIGSQSPTYKLVVSNGGAAGYEFNVNGLNGGVNTVVYNRSTSAYVDSAHFALNYYIFTGSTPAEVLRATSAGEVWIKNTSDQGSYNLQVGGTGVWGAGAYVNGSDERLKKSIATYTDNAVDLVNKMRPVTFEYVEGYSDDRATQIGFIAQDLQNVLQGKEYLDGIVKDDAEHLNVAYQSLIPVLTKAIQELTARIEALEAA